MSLIKVYIPTYNRHDLFPRAIESLMTQTFTDWIAEVHNDFPGDSFPFSYINSLHDPRISVVNHEENIGANATFNLFFKSVNDTEFVCILEDDNWWEPEYLAEMILALGKYKELNVAYANHYIWQQNSDAGFSKLGLKYSSTDFTYSLIQFPTVLSVYGYHFSNCSIVFRNRDLSNYVIPKSTRGDFMEHVRERAFLFPLLFVNKPLVNFSLTISSYRSEDLNTYAQHEALLIASFFKTVKVNEDFIQQFIADIRNGFGLTVNKLIFAAIIDRKSFFLLRFIKTKEWLFFIFYCFKRPGVLWAVYRAKKDNQDLWRYLIHHTGNKYTDEQIYGSEINTMLS